MFLFPGYKFIIKDVLVPCRSVLIAPQSTGFISFISRQALHPSSKPVEYFAIFTRAGRRGRNRVTLAKLEVNHSKFKRKLNEAVINKELGVVKVITYKINVMDLQSHEFIAFLLANYFYIAKLLQQFIPKHVFDRNRLDEIFNVVNTNGLFKITDYSDILVPAINYLSSRDKDLKGLYTKYSRQNPNFMSMRDTELKFMRYYVARYSRLIDGHIKYLMMNRF